MQWEFIDNYEEWTAVEVKINTEDIVRLLLLFKCGSGVLKIVYLHCYRDISLPFLLHISFVHISIVGKTHLFIVLFYLFRQVPVHWDVEMSKDLRQRVYSRLARPTHTT